MCKSVAGTSETSLILRVAAYHLEEFIPRQQLNGSARGIKEINNINPAIEHPIFVYSFITFTI